MTLTKVKKNIQMCQMINIRKVIKIIASRSLIQLFLNTVIRIVI